MSSRAIEFLTIRIGGDIDEVLEAFDAVGTRAQRLGRRMERTGRRLTVGVTLPIAGVGTAALKMASEAEEAGNKFDVVMGSAADRVRGRLEGLTATIPLTTAEMERMAAGVQDLLVPMGVVRGEAADMSADMVELAGDIASFNDVLPTEVLAAMQSALAGQSEPMRRFGVDTRKTRLEALALEEGLIRQGQALDSTAQAQAVMIAIQRDSTDAMGDAARTIDSTSNQMKFMVRNAKELSLSIGGTLIPVVTPLIAKATGLLGVMAALDPEIIQVGVGIAAVAASIGPLLIVGGKLAGVFSLVLTPAGLIVAALAAMATTAVVVVKNWDVLALQGTLAWTALKDAVFEAVSRILGSLELIPLVGQKIRDLKADFDAFHEESLANANDRILELERRLSDSGAEMALLSESASTAGDSVREVGEAAATVALPAVEKLDMGSRLLASGMTRLQGDVESLTSAQYALADGTNAAADAQDRLNDAQNKARGILGGLGNLGRVLGITIPGLDAASGLLGAFGSFAGLFADGGTIPAGSFGLVAEAGRPEIVSSPTFVSGPAAVTPMGASMEAPAFVLPPAQDPIEYAHNARFMRAFDAWWREWRGNGGGA